MLFCAAMSKVRERAIRVCIFDVGSFLHQGDVAADADADAADS